jgi:uncharacterized protein (TIGR03435 family)
MIHIICKAYTATMLANIVRSLGSPTINSPVADQTGLQGNWDFEMEFTLPGLGGGSGAGIADAVENQLGLKLEQKRTDQPVLVIESMDTVPTENAPGIVEHMLPPLPPMTLEVATIKPSAPPPNGGPILTGILGRSDGQGGMQLEARGARLSTLIQQGWSVTPDRMIGLPPSADDQQFDVVMKLSGSGGLSTTTIGPIFQGLVKERFKLEAHLEDRPMDAYKLVAVKPKMTKADPSNRASCKSAPSERVQGQQTVTCRNMTMGEFAERLQGYSIGAIRTPVVDATKLEGMWDFTFSFTPQLPPGLLPAGAAPVSAPAPPPLATTAGAAPVPLASEPSDALTLFEAISGQLGLKLELEKRPMPVLIIEHVEKTPTEN